ncbi:TetR/AcrR family transcriptional regulator [Chromobacterium subtsugae]|uniref:TetR/AcrR family transcriptional regulator n=1 Tax=Chromobacterium subtsugae TaxID=251747 RepID=A0ABS7FDV9_9NEIS|nr:MULTISPECIES: TetR/AcrR family transcriptional regulator [Chromobacterium]KUM04589.1 hypothetical protein Cv017_13700 [Chromobacterium subtsugae]KZE87530.1 TetR family transcriptional regulator [Chromobacterium sp. F49]MBW7566565.1 TetR family transcriptional regulator [Chromobacterium subtsugae]MBW8288252.1 TetR/AcrR family transcriptional regulator [Chromobacterium subtsugae]OBU87355.1 hypothetical protein MY55_07350 [Chromobacterium subtsugae]
MSIRISGPRLAMRKAPRQARSRATVDVIVEAGARVLGARGWGGFTTSEVAGVAGVSIGSLYQYFPNKIVLVDAIRRRHFDEVLAALQRVCDGLGRPECPLERLVDGMIAVHGGCPALHRALLDVPVPDEMRAAGDAFQAEYLRRYRAIVAGCRGVARDEDDELAAQTISSAIEGVVHNAARRGRLAEAGVRRELVRLLRAYLGDCREGR